MTSTPNVTPTAQAVTKGDIKDGTILSSRAGPMPFALGGTAEYGGTASGPNPYDLLSASLASCTAMTVRAHARHKRYPLSHVEAAVSYHHGSAGERAYFERAIVLQGDLDGEQRAELLRGAMNCPVAATLSSGADIDTRLAGEALLTTEGPKADYFEDLFSIVNIDPD